MRKTKRLLAMLLVLALCFTLGISAGAEDATGTATASGFGGDVTVTLTWDGEKITSIEIDAPGETPGVGGAAVPVLQQAILEAGSLDVDAVSGATNTSRGVINAATLALAQAKGEEASSTELKDGVYTGEAWGFGLTKKLAANVTVEGGKITAIEIGEENSETASVLQSAIDLLIPRIIENQSIGIDAITGATGSSNGIKSAVLDAVVQAGGDSAQFSKAVHPEAGPAEEYSVDVAVVGFGGSGSTAALAAAENGASVLVLEKAGKIGGTSAVTGGPMSVNEEADVEANGGEPLVDEEAFLAAWEEYTTVDGVQDAKPEIIAELIDMSGETNTWLKGHGFSFVEAINFLGGEYRIYTPWEGDKALTQGMFEVLANDLVGLGGQYMLETEVTDLLYEDGVVSGVKAVKADGTEVTVHAKKVILATGGFGGSSELMTKYLGEDWKLYGMAQNEGTGIRLGTEAGGATWNIDMPPMSHFAAPEVITNSFEDPFDNDILYAMAGTSEILAVTRAGNRFLNEELLQYSAYVGGSRFYSIYSSDQIDILRESGFAKNTAGRYLNHYGVTGVPTENVPLAKIDEALERGIQAGFVIKADTLEELAEKIAEKNGVMTAESLIATVKAYNEGVEAKNDALGKTEASYERLGAINEDAEYYIAVTGAPYIYSTCGGLSVDENMRVVDENGNVIENLYAVGTDSMGVLFTNKKGYANYGGVAQGYCLVSGRIAGTDAANSLK